MSLNKGLATVTLKPGNTVRLVDIWQAIRNNGFTPKEAKVVVRAEVIGGTKTELRITGSNEVCEVILSSKGPLKTIDEIRQHAGKPVTVEGTLEPAAKDVKAAVPFAVTKLNAN